jgi:hypothetical protein
MIANDLNSVRKSDETTDEKAPRLFGLRFEGLANGLLAFPAK